MEEEFNNQELNNEEFNNQEPEEAAGCVGIGFSFFFPIVGIIMYFTQKKSVYNPSAYLYAALGGFGLGILLRIVTGAIQ
jgi:hypothetical protein